MKSAPTERLRVTWYCLVYIQVSDERTQDLIASQIAITKSMIKGSCGVIVSRNPQALDGLVSENVDSTITVSIQADGKIDALAEAKKLQRQLAMARQNQDKLQKRMNQTGYEKAVPAAVKAKDAERVSTSPDSWTSAYPRCDGCK